MGSAQYISSDEWKLLCLYKFARILAPELQPKTQSKRAVGRAELGALAESAPVAQAVVGPNWYY